jgi:hypothetical protein
VIELRAYYRVLQRRKKMKIFTKEWHRLLDSSNIVDMYEPIEDRDYTDEEINAMYQTLPECIREAVDPRLLALNLLPESVYNKLKAEDEKAEARFEELDEIAPAGAGLLARLETLDANLNR